MPTKNATSANSNAEASALNASHSLYRKILTVQQQSAGVPKRGYNAFHKYYYATEADILSVKEILNESGLIVLPTTLHEETGLKPDGKSWARVTLLFRVVDVATGEHVEAQFTGYAEDNFDKAIYKATTGANKYFYLKFFGIATEDDPEREDAPLPASKSGASVPSPLKKVAPVKAEAAPSAAAEQKNLALFEANKILAFQKRYHLSNEEILTQGGIDSIKALAEAGEVNRLAQAYSRLVDYVRLQKSS